jgi:hypothetical protein
MPDLVVTVHYRALGMRNHFPLSAINRAATNLRIPRYYLVV